MNLSVANYYEDFSAFSHYGITVNSMQGEYLYVNPTFCKLVGYTEEELLGKGFQFITHPDDNERNVTLDTLLRDGVIPFFQMRKRYMHKCKHIIDVLLQVAILRGDEDVYVAMIMDITDLSEKINPSDQISHALDVLPEEFHHLLVAYEYINRYKLKNQRKSNHLANMVHELRTPLNSINGFSNLLRKYIELGDLAKSGEAIDYIVEGCKKLNRTVSEILDVEMLEKGSLGLDKECLNLSALLSSAVDFLVPFAKEHNLSLRKDVDLSNPIHLVADGVRLDFIFNNLISNAIKYTEQGCVTVSLAHVENDRVAISISDTGIGIREEDFDALFDEYQKVDHRINKSVDSVGLGLPITKKLVELHNGELEVESEVGRGTTFKVYLPLI